MRVEYAPPGGWGSARGRACAHNGLRFGGWQVGAHAIFHMVALRDVQLHSGVTCMEILLVPQLVLACEWSRTWERCGKQAAADAMLKWAGDHRDLAHDLHTPFVQLHKAFALPEQVETSDESCAAYDGEGTRDPDGFI